MEFFIGGIINFGGNFAPRDWAFCDGQLIAINQNQALFAILGTTWGGDGRTTFALPDMRSRCPIGAGRGAGLTNINQGQQTGTETVTMQLAQMPLHGHDATFTGTGGGPSALTATATVNAFDGTAAETSPSAHYWSTPKSGISALASYGTTANTTMAADAVDVAIAGNGGGITGGTVAVNNNGGGQPFSIMQPTLGMQYIICLQGLFPSRN
ncbi:phage tail protein [Thalassomonas haliotis]|uniref:Phage tail protein n=1 Tax=Thalassomonas haliotis TaxID=485448 RepID=A0ABY7VCL7_9GAMM|nr:tail fiber protein [Thalassomonas haliotis]WDE11296.1 phage tail protein [Thalassomonas haliotis]